MFSLYRGLVPCIFGASVGESTMHAVKPPALYPAFHVTETSLGPGPVELGGDQQNSVFERIKKVVRVLGKKVRSGGQDLVGPGLTLLDTIENSGPKSESTR